MTTQTEIDQLAALLDGAIGASEVSPQLASLASLAGQVTATIPVALPTLAFREALRGELLQSVAANAAATAASGVASSGVSGGAASFGSQVATWVAGLTASALLATTGVVAFAPAAVPGDSLYGAKRVIEQGQLRVADPADRAALLLDLATLRVEEALFMTDVLDVERLLDDSQRQLRDALALLDELPVDVATALVADQVAEHTAALQALRARVTEDVLTVRIDRLLTQTATLVTLLGSTTIPVADVPATDGSTADDATTAPQQPQTDPEGPATGVVTDDGAVPTGDATDDATGDATDPADDILDDLTDPVDDILDDATDPVDDVVGGTSNGVGDLLRP